VANANGSPYASFTFQVQDNGGTGEWRHKHRRHSANDDGWRHCGDDAPVGTAKTVTTLEDTPYIFKTTDFGFTDSSDMPANTLLAVKMTTLPTAGSLTDNGTAVAVGAHIRRCRPHRGQIEVYAGGECERRGVIPASRSRCRTTAERRMAGSTLMHGAKDDDCRDVREQRAVGAAKTVAATKNTAYVFKVIASGFHRSSDTPTNTFSGGEDHHITGAREAD